MDGYFVRIGGSLLRSSQRREAAIDTTQARPGRSPAQKNYEAEAEAAGYGRRTDQTVIICKFRIRMLGSEMRKYGCLWGGKVGWVGCNGHRGRQRRGLPVYRGTMEYCMHAEVVEVDPQEKDGTSQARKRR